MRTTAAGAAARLGADETSLCHVVTITCRAGNVINLTNAQADVTIGATVFDHAPGFLLNSIVFSDDGQPSALDMQIGMMDSGPLADQKIIPGFFDGARIQIWVADYMRPDLGKLYQIGGVLKLGDLTYDNLRGAFSASLVSESNDLVELFIRKITPGCAWQFGDPATCAVNVIGSYMATGAVVSVPSVRALVITSSDFRAAIRDGWYAYGGIKFTTGANANLSREIRVWEKETMTARLWISFPAAIQAGDEFQIYPGCDLTTGQGGCGKFSNIARYGGFPFVTEKGFNSPIEVIIQQQRTSGGKGDI